MTSLRPVVESDVSALAKLYRRSLPGDLAVWLGQRFCGRVFESVLAIPGSSVVVAEVDGRIVGFCAIVADRPAVNRRLIVPALTALAARPTLALRIVADCLRPSFFRSFFDRSDEETKGCREVYLIAVAPESQRVGWGGRLLQSALADGGYGCCLAATTVLSAIEFYIAQGFRRYREMSRGRRTMTVLVHGRHS